MFLIQAQMIRFEIKKVAGTKSLLARKPLLGEKLTARPVGWISGQNPYVKFVLIRRTFRYASGVFWSRIAYLDFGKFSPPKSNENHTCLIQPK